MFAKLEEVEKRYDHLNGLMSDPKVIARQHEFQQYAREQSELSPIIAEYRSYKKIQDILKENHKICEEETDDEIIVMAREEIVALETQIIALEEKIKEASLFAVDLFRMYTRYAEAKKWKSEILSQSETGKGGFKEVIFSIQGKGVYSKLKYEGGTHRVQRVPETETQGRVHTSAVTVAIMPQVDDVDITIRPGRSKCQHYGLCSSHNPRAE
jgi:peptide chain release factor 1